MCMSVLFLHICAFGVSFSLFVNLLLNLSSINLLSYHHKNSVSSIAIISENIKK